MAQLTKKQRYELECIRGNLQRAMKYLQNDKIFVASERDPRYPLGNNYTIVNPAAAELFGQPKVLELAVT